MPDGAHLAAFAAVALGVSAIIAASATAFEVLRYAGAAYLIWLGVRTLCSAGEWRRQRIGSGLLLIGLGGAAAATGGRSQTSP